MHKDVCSYINLTPSAYFLAPSPQVAAIFSGAVAGEEEKTSARGVLRTHILYFIYFILLALLYIKNSKKLESLVVVISLL
jgi:hypothetical protein